MKSIQKTKSRQKLYDAVGGAKELTGAGGRSAVGKIVFANNPAEDETVTLGAAGSFAAVTFTFKATPDGENQVDIGGDLSTSIDNLIAAVLAHSVTGQWGYIYPDDSVGLQKLDTNTSIQFTFWPGAWANSVTLAGSAGDETITQPVTASLGRNSPIISSAVNWNIIDTTGGTQNKEFWVIPDGGSVGATCKIMVKTFDTGDTPTLLGKLEKKGTAYVEALIATAEPGKSAEFLWTGASWELVNELDIATDYTALAFTASA